MELKAHFNGQLSRKYAQNSCLDLFSAVSFGKPGAIMTSYNAVNGVPTAASPDLIKNILRNEWGFDGLVVTDWEGDGPNALAALKAGNNLFMPGFTGQIKHLLKGLDDKTISRDDLEQAAIPLLKRIMHTNAFANYYKLEGENTDYQLPVKRYN